MYLVRAFLPLGDLSRIFDDMMELGQLQSDDISREMVQALEAAADGSDCETKRDSFVWYLIQQMKSDQLVYI
jgi:hypothetical protein